MTSTTEEIGKLIIPPDGFVTNTNLTEKLYDSFCIECHDTQGKGTQYGAARAHLVYGPQYHTNRSFFLAVSTGIKAYHWQYGDITKVSSVATEDAAYIESYIQMR